MVIITRKSKKKDTLKNKHHISDTIGENKLIPEKELAYTPII
jgi:hypothetical protein